MATIKRRKGKKEEEGSNLPVPIKDNSKVIEDGERAENTTAVEQNKAQQTIRTVLIPEETLVVEESRFEKPHFIIQTILTVVGLGTLFAFIFFSALQHDDNAKTLKSTMEALELAKQNADSSDAATKRSLDIALRSAIATENAAKATRQTVEITERVAKIQLQPELRIETACSDLEAGKRFPVKITIENTGPKAALNWRTKSVMLPMPASRIDDFFQIKVNPPTTQNVLPRNSPIEIEVTLPDTLTANEITEIRNGRLIICLQVVAFYSDAWGEPQTTKFRHTYSPYRKSFVFYIPTGQVK